MNIKWILWPTDGSDESNEALEVALYFARTFGAGLVCMHVVQTSLAAADLQPAYEDVIEEVLRQTEERFKTLFERLKLENPDLRVSYIISRGGVAESIADLTLSDRDGIVVMGKRGRGMIGSILLGSNTLSVLRSSTVPVLSVKLGGDGKGYTAGKILVPVDISEPTDGALGLAVMIAAKTGASITAVHVVWIDVNLYETVPELAGELVSRAESKLKDFVDGALRKYERESGGKFTGKIDTRVEYGLSPAVAITRFAKDEGFDLIAINSHGRKGLEKLFLGSESEKVVRESPCPVLAVKPTA